jgi:RecG-like helicase
MELNVHTFGDLLGYYPFRYIDRSRIYKISEIEPEVRQQKATLLQSFAGAPDPSSSASEGASQLAEEHQQADDEA